MILLEKAKIYGVDKVGQSSPTLVRTDAAVGLSYSVGESKITSDFNKCYPWSEMNEVVDDQDNIFIKIPKFYTKITKNADGTYKHQISGVKYEGYTTLFIDGKGNEIDYVLVGKYEGSGSSSHVYSKSGQTVLVNITQANFRTGCKANGDGYQQYDFLIDMIIKELFLIEFATTNSQSIMAGYTATSNTAALTTGHTDAVSTPSGSPTSNTAATYSMKYRGIENLWGNTWTFVDGVAFDKEKVYVCTDPTQYESGKITEPYSYMGDRPTTEGYLKTITPFEKNPLLGYSTQLGAGNGSHYCDYSYYNDAGQILLVGGLWHYGLNAGLWSWSGYSTVSSSWALIGGRLCYKPL